MPRTDAVGLSVAGKRDTFRSMAVRPIVLYPDPVLLEPTRPVQTVDAEIRELARDMVETMYRAPGIGLAANQVGISSRVCVVDTSGGEEPEALLVLINPVVRETSGSQLGEEGCLSFPEITLEIERAERATVEALDLDGKSCIYEVEGLLARVVLHECEHLDGRTFLRNISSLKRELVKRRIRKRIDAGDWVETATT
jgi:peptide deformylase